MHVQRELHTNTECRALKHMIGYYLGLLHSFTLEPLNSCLTHKRKGTQV